MPSKICASPARTTRHVDRREKTADMQVSLPPNATTYHDFEDEDSVSAFWLCCFCVGFVGYQSRRFARTVQMECSKNKNCARYSNQLFLQDFDDDEDEASPFPHLSLLVFVLVALVCAACTLRKRRHP